MYTGDIAENYLVARAYNRYGALYNLWVLRWQGNKRVGIYGSCVASQSS